MSAKLLILEATSCIGYKWRSTTIRGHIQLMLAVNAEREMSKKEIIKENKF